MSVEARVGVNPQFDTSTESGRLAVAGAMQELFPGSTALWSFDGTGDELLTIVDVPADAIGDNLGALGNGS